MRFNPEQQQAVNHFTGPCIVTANPGSGKTSVITGRVVALIKDRQVPPQNILGLTFTNKAAEEMKERVGLELGEEVSANIWISTFHAFCLAILRKYGTLVNVNPGFSIYDSSAQQELMSKICRMHEISDVNSNYTYGLIKACNDYRETLEDITHLSELNEVERSVINEYLDTLRDFNAVDFSGILHRTWLLLRDRSEVRTALSNKFRYIMVDECQDTNPIQYEIVKLVASHQNIFVVGDLNQGIFSFRMARPENVNLLKKDFANTVEINLPRNYRSTTQILAVAERLIRHNKNAKSTTLIAERGGGSEVSLREFDMPEDEAAFIAQSIVHIKHANKYNWKDFAILYRANHLSKIHEMTLRQQGIPYRIVGGFSFFDRSEIKTTLAYMSLVSNPKDTVAFSRAIAYPKRKVGDVVVGKLERVCQKHQVSILDAIGMMDNIPGITQAAKVNLAAFGAMLSKHQQMDQSKVGVATVASSILKESGYYEYIQKQAEKDDDSKKRSDNVEEFLVGLADFDKSKPGSKISDYLHSISTITSEETDDSDGVTLLTMHSSKGLEFPVVYAVSIEQGIIPHSRSKGDAEIEEERRLMYVCSSRARDRLFVSHCNCRKRFDFKKKQNVFKPAFPSPFLHEMFPHLVKAPLCMEEIDD